MTSACRVMHMQGPALASVSAPTPYGQLHPGSPLLRISITCHPSSLYSINTVSRCSAGWHRKLHSHIPATSSKFATDYLQPIMSEKAILASATPVPSAMGQQRPVTNSSKRHAMGRVFAIAATAALILYGLPRGMYIALGYSDAASDTC